MMKKIIFIVVLAFSLGIKAQKVKGINKNYKTSVLVKGNCEMCKTRIEKSALNTKGVKYAVWDMNSKLLKLIYNQKKTTLQKIQKSILNVGHDVDSIKSSDQVYQQLHMCCQYRK